MNLRALRPRATVDEIPNGNDPASVPPATVGPPAAVPGDPDGVVVVGDSPPWSPLPPIVASAWSGWPAGWATPSWSGSSGGLADTVFMCLDLNTDALASMPPYLVNAASTLDADWLNNPDPALYTAWEDFARSLFWDFYMGEAFVQVTARYATGWPARFHVVPPWTINVEMDGGTRYYTIGGVDVTPDILHIRYQGGILDAHGHGPLEAGQYRVVAAQALLQYGTRLVQTGGIPAGVLESQEEVSPEQAVLIQQQWVTRRMSTLGEPAVLTNGLQWKPTQVNPTDLSLLDLERYHDSRIAYLLGVPGPLVGLPSGEDSLTYNTAVMLREQHWQVGLRPKAQRVMSALSGWALPRGTRVELNRDEYTQPGPLERAQTAKIWAGIVDPVTGKPVLSVDEIRAAERLDNSKPADVAQGVLR